MKNSVIAQQVHRTFQDDLIRTMYEEVKALGEFRELPPITKDLQKEVTDLKATRA